MFSRASLRILVVTLAVLAPCCPASAGWGVSWTFVGSAGIATNGSAYNNPVAPEGKQAAFIQGTGAAEQAFDVPAAGRHTITWQASVRWFPDTNHDYDVMVDGAAILRVDSSKISPYKYTPLSAAVDLAAGKHTLRFQGVNSKGGEHTSFVDAVAIKGIAAVPLVNAGFDDVSYASGSFAMRPPAATTPLARLEAKVTTSGRAIYGRLVAISGGAYLPMTSMAVSPSVRVNGTDVGATTTLVNTGEHEGFVLFLPDPVMVRAGDVVTLSAPPAWATVANDFAEPMVDQPVEVCTGRSFVGSDAIKPALKVGLDIGYGFIWDNHSLFKNLRYKMQAWDVGGVVGFDGDGYPTRLAQDAATCAVIDYGHNNAIDGTGTPMPEGLYAVGWGRASGGVDCSLVSNGATVTERTDLANPGGADGRGLVRVFDFRRRPNAPRVDFDVRLKITDKSRAPRLSYLAIHGPGDFKVAANTPTVLDGIDDPAALSSLTLDRLSGGVGVTRWTQDFVGYHNTAYACEPEDLNTESMWCWNGWKRAWTVRYKQARPWTPQDSPYAYSPLFGQPFPATLGTALDAPVPGTKQVVEIPDAATAPVFEGLVLAIEQERCRVVSGSGTTWTIERGSESTTPSAHAAGPIAVSGRTPLTSLADFASGGMQVIELVATAPHRLRTGNHPMLDGFGWALWPMVDGSTTLGGSTLRLWELGILVTGPDRFIITAGGGKGPGNTTLAAPLDLDPAQHYSQIISPGAQGLPFATAAKVSAKIGGDFLASIPFAASDSYVDAVARIVLDNFPAGRRVYLEYINEPWNWAYPTTHTGSNLSWLLGRQSKESQLWQVRRTGQIHKRFAAIFAGKGRASEVRSVLNMQMALAGHGVRDAVKRAIDEGLPAPDVAVAPYVDLANWPSLVKGFNVAGMDRAVDLWTYSLCYGKADSTGSGTSSLPTAWSASCRSAVDAVNKEFGTSIELFGYEGGASTSWPVVNTSLARDASAGDAKVLVANASLFSAGQMIRVGPEWVRITGITGNELALDRPLTGAAAGPYKAGTFVRNSYLESSRDLTYHPNFRIAEFDQFGLWQKYYGRVCLNGYSGQWNDGYHQWCQYHWIGQLPGKGDGSDGMPDNRLTLATPGLPTSKPGNVNQDLASVSVRGQAMLEWNSRIAPPPPPVPSAPAGLAAKSDSPSTVAVSWAASPGASGYSLQRSPGGSAWAEIAAPGADAVSYADSGLTSGTAYSYRIAAINPSGASPYGDAVSVTTLPPPPPPPPDLAAQAGALSDGIAELAKKLSDLSAMAAKLKADADVAKAGPVPR